MNSNQLTTLQVDWNLLFGSMITFVFMVGMIRMVSRELLTEHHSQIEEFAVSSNPKRVTFDRGDLSSAIDAARRLKSDKDLYIVPTAHGLSIERVKPPTWLRHIVVKPDGTIEEVAMSSNPGGESNQQIEIERYHGVISKVGDAVVKDLNLPDWLLDYIEYPAGQMPKYRDALSQARAKIVKVTNERIYFTQE